EIKKISADLNNGKCKFAIAMIDLNFLKKMNDSYGHDKGNLAIKKLCMLVCNIFSHSPVFRIGGDEFVIILKNRDYDNANELIYKFNSEIEMISHDDNLEPWDRISAAIGVAYYDSKTDKTVDEVFKRADANMYKRKQEMKALRE
ncbi:MAG: GGDEF domain-containing protein, partial [Butyrivibrio sp.]|nr:GGDEF domain-containing protein [Butyrivibrio sp.]